MKKSFLLVSILGFFLCRASLSETTASQAMSESPKRADSADIESDFPYGENAVSKFFKVDFNVALNSVLEQLDKRGISVSKENRKTGFISASLRTSYFHPSKSSFPKPWVCAFDIKLRKEEDMTRISISMPCGNNCENDVCMDGYDVEAKDAIDLLDALSDKFKKVDKTDDSK